MATDDHYTIISADCHAGANHATYREYLEAKYLDDFDAWRGKYKNPFRDLQDGGRAPQLGQRAPPGDLHADGQVGEVVFPNTVPPFFPSFVLFARPPKPDEFEHRLAGIRAHNRWVADWCAEYADERAGMGQIFLNDVDEAIKDLHFIKEHNLRGGVLIPTLAPDVKYDVRRCTTRCTTRSGARARSSRSRSTRTADRACPTTASTPSPTCSTSSMPRSTRSARCRS